MRLLATALFVIGIAGLYWLVRNRSAKTSPALWIPVIWFLVGGSRNFSEWLQMRGPVADADRYLEGSPLDRNILTGLLAVAVIVLARRGDKVWLFLRGNSAIVLFFAYCGISVLWSDYPDVAAKRWFRSVGDLAMVVVILTETLPVAAGQRVLTRVGFTLLPVSILLIRYYPDLGRSYSRWTGAGSWTGVTTDKNGLGMICAIFGLAAAWHLLQSRAPDKPRYVGASVAYALVVGMAIWLLATADSATAMSCFALAGAAMALTSSSWLTGRPLLVHVVAAAAIGLPVAAMFFQSLDLLSFVGRDSTFTGRTEIWSRAVEILPNRLVGAGFESFWLGERLESMADLNHPNQAHNGYLEIFLNLGWLGIGLLARVLVVGYRRITTSIRHGSATGPLRLAFFVTACVYNLTEGGFKMMHPVWLVFLLATTLLPDSAAAPLPADDRTRATRPIAPGGRPWRSKRARLDYEPDVNAPRGARRMDNARV